MRPLLFCFPILLGVGLCFAAAPPPKPARADDQLDYLFLASDRPVLIRLHVRVGDKPYGAPWAEFMDKLFAWFDKDDDGFLSPAEVARLPSATFLISQARGSIRQETTGVPLEAIDTNKDGKVSKDELFAYYRNGGFSGFQFNTNDYQAVTAKQINEGIYKRLDKAGEGYLTADKVAGMYEKLRALDGNEDEMLDEAELTTRTNPDTYRRAAPDSISRTVAASTEPSLLEISPSRKPDLVKQMMDKYDRNKDGKLTRAEVGLPPGLFDQFDTDKDGVLDAAEVRAFLASEPDLVLRFQVGTPSKGKGVVDLFAGPRLFVVNEKTLGAAMSAKFRRPDSDSVAVKLGDTHMTLRGAAPPTQRPSSAKAKHFYLREYDLIAGKKGHVERADEKGQQPYLFQLFSQADKNGDGKLTRLELIAWLDFVATSQDANLTITVNDFGRGLFPILDANGDGKLSPREMKGAWARLKPFARDGKVTQADLPRTLRITVGQENTPILTRKGLAFRIASQAPDWFRKMDKNNDCDVSRTEWLGTDEDFKAIDADGDGLISAAEAIAFETKKNQKKDKP